MTASQDVFVTWYVRQMLRIREALKGLPRNPVISITFGMSEGAVDLYGRIKLGVIRHEFDISVLTCTEAESHYGVDLEEFFWQQVSQYLDHHDQQIKISEGTNRIGFVFNKLRELTQSNIAEARLWCVPREHHDQRNYRRYEGQ